MVDLNGQVSRFPKKDGQSRLVNDSRALNRALKRQVYPLPKIQHILNDRPGYKYFTKIDIAMQYYTFELDEASQKLCTIVTRKRKYQYVRMPMGTSQAPDISQEIMNELFTISDKYRHILMILDALTNLGRPFDHPGYRSFSSSRKWLHPYCKKM